MTITLTILGSGSSAGVPRPALGWGAADPSNPKNRRMRCSLLAERVTLLQWAGLLLGLFGVFLIVRGNLSGGAAAPPIAWLAAVAALIGITIGPGWRKKMLALLGDVKGCTHLVELLGPLATTAFQATNRARENRRAADPAVGAKRPFQINACHMYKEDGEWVKERWPQWYTG